MPWLLLIPFALVGLGLKSAADEVQQFMNRDGNTQAPPPPPPPPVAMTASAVPGVNPYAAVAVIALAFGVGVFVLGRASK